MIISPLDPSSHWLIESSCPVGRTPLASPHHPLRLAMGAYLYRPPRGRPSAGGPAKHARRWKWKTGNCCTAVFLWRAWRGEKRKTEKIRNEEKENAHIFQTARGERREGTRQGARARERKSLGVFLFWVFLRCNFQAILLSLSPMWFSFFPLLLFLFFLFGHK